jgi:hypothetical protein
LRSHFPTFFRINQKLKKLDLIVQLYLHKLGTHQNDRFPTPFDLLGPHHLRIHGDFLFRGQHELQCQFVSLFQGQGCIKSQPGRADIMGLGIKWRS